MASFEISKVVLDVIDHWFLILLLWLLQVFRNRSKLKGNKS